MAPVKAISLNPSGSEGRGASMSANNDHRSFVRLDEHGQGPWQDSQSLYTTTVGLGKPEDIYVQPERTSVSSKGNWLTGKRPRGRTGSITHDSFEMQVALSGQGGRINVRNDVDVHWTAKEPVRS